MQSRRELLKMSLAVGLGALVPAPSWGAEDLEAVVVQDVSTGQVLQRRGVCAQRFTPASTFKLPLALIGFDAGILQDPHHPSWGYRPEFQAPERDHKTVDPTTWLRDSVVWYSQEITRRLGVQRFQHDVDLLDYGNRDLSGNPGKGDGLTRSWLSSSLAVSADEQVRFLVRMLKRQLHVSDHAYAMTAASMPVFSAEGWTVRGKTGSGALATRKLGWFVGWAEKDDRCLAFARLLVPSTSPEEFMGPRVRREFLRELPSLARGA